MLSAEPGHFYGAHDLMAELECDVASGHRPPHRNYDERDRDQEAFLALRDEEDRSALALLLVRRLYGKRERYWPLLALPTLELLRRREASWSAAAVARFLSSLHETPHRVPHWDALLRETAVNALQACTGFEIGDDPVAWRAALEPAPAR